MVNDSIGVIDTEALGRRGVVAAYFVRGKECALIDMGYRSSAEVIMRDLADGGIADRDLDYLLPTHVHLDHAGSCGTLARWFTLAKVFVHPRGEPHLRDPTRLVKGAEDLFGQDRIKRYGLPETIDNKRLRSVGDDEIIDLGDGVTLRAIWTPGHAPHHLSYHFEEGKALFTGDAVGVHHPEFPILIPTTPPPSFNFDQAIASIKRLSTLSSAHIFTPHFGMLDDPARRLEQNFQALADWKGKLERYIAAGTERDEIAQALTSELCGRLGRDVSDVPDYLHVMIRVSVVGFLRFLTWNKTEPT